jgi:GxxExxY protein
MLLKDGRINELTHDVLGAAIEIHRALGPGLLESAYSICLRSELGQRGRHYVVQRPVPLTYKGVHLDAVYRIDLLVEDLLVVEIKAVDTVLSIHQAQLLTYLKLTGCPVGLLINFNVPRLMDGVRRLLNIAR